jgi:hypothetical protein
LGFGGRWCHSTDNAVADGGVGPAEMADAMPLVGLRGGSFRKAGGAQSTRDARKTEVSSLMCAKIRATRFETLRLVSVTLPCGPPASLGPARQCYPVPRQVGNLYYYIFFLR